MPRASLPADGSVRAVGRDLLPLRLRDEVTLLLVLGPPRQKRQGVQTQMHRQNHAQRRVDVLEFLAGQAEADVVHAGAAVLGGHRHAEQTQFRHLGQDPAIELVGAIELADPRRHLASRPFADGLLEQALLLGQVETEHQADGATGVAPGASGALRKRTSRRLVLRRNCSTMRSGSNSRWMSRLGNGRCLGRAAT